MSSHRQTRIYKRVFPIAEPDLPADDSHISMVSPLADLNLLASPVANLLILLALQHLAQTCSFSSTWLPNFLSYLTTRPVWFSPAITHWHTHINWMCRLIGLSGCCITGRQTDLQLSTCRSPYAHACWTECPVMQEKNSKCNSMTDKLDWSDAGHDATRHLFAWFACDWCFLTLIPPFCKFVPPQSCSFPMFGSSQTSHNFMCNPEIVFSCIP